MKKGLRRAFLLVFLLLLSSHVSGSLLSLGAQHACAILNQQALCWGKGDVGQLGTGNTANVGMAAGDMTSLTPITFGTLVKDVFSGYESSCVLTNSGGVRCFGARTGYMLTPGAFDVNIGDSTGEMSSLPSITFKETYVATQVAVGFAHICALFDTVWRIRCWGSNADGALGITTNSGINVDLANMPYVSFSANNVPITAVVAGAYHTCALFDGSASGIGAIRCFGKATFGQIGTGATTYSISSVLTMNAIAFSDSSPAIAISAGHSFNCAIFAVAAAGANKIRCFGDNAFGQLGNGAVGAVGDAAGEIAAQGFIAFSTTDSATAISTGGSHACAFFANAGIRCWGSGIFGQLGTGAQDDVGLIPGETAAIKFLTFSDTSVPTAISCGESFTCVLFSNTKSRCFGKNSEGQLGYGDTTTRGDNIGEILALPFLTYAAGLLSTDNTLSSLIVYLPSNALMSPAFSSAITAYFVSIPYETTALWISPYTTSNLASLYVNDVVHIQSTSRYITIPYASIPVLVSIRVVAQNGDVAITRLFFMRRQITTVAAGESHSCAIVNARLICFGLNNLGQLGYNDVTQRGHNTATMTAIPYIAFSNNAVTTYPTDIALGREHSCAQFGNGKVICWGSTANLQLGTPLGTGCLGCSSNQINTMAYLAFNDANVLVAQISAGLKHTCALMSNGRVICFGANASGQLGQNSLVDIPTVNTNTIPFISFQTTDDAIAVSAGATSSCALFRSGGTDFIRARCWGGSAGESYGQLGTNLLNAVGDSVASTISNLGYITFQDSNSILQISAGSFHTCATFIDGRVRCWGAKTKSPSLIGYTSAVPCAGAPAPCIATSSLPYISHGVGSLARSVSAGAAHTCILFESRQAKCFGDNTNYQLGIGTTPTCVACDDLTPVSTAASVTVNIPPSPSSIYQISSRFGAHTIASLSDGRVLAWGSNSNGQLGIAAPTTPVTSASTSKAQWLALYENIRTLYAISPSLGLLNPSFSSSTFAYTMTVASSTPSITLRPYASSSYATIQVRYNGAGGFALIASGSAATITLVDGSSNVVEFLVTAENGGTSTYTTTITRLVAISPPGVPSGATAVATGGRHSCVVIAGRIMCMGHNGSGQLGYGDTVSRGLAASDISSLVFISFSNNAVLIQGITAGIGHTCVLFTSGKIICFGLNANSQLATSLLDSSGVSCPGSTCCYGCGPNQMIIMPYLAFSLGNLVATQISGGAHHTCALFTDFKVRCWGLGFYGALGVSSTSDYGSSEESITLGLLPAVAFTDGLTVTAISAGYYSSCALFNTGKLRCWGGANGFNVGQLGTDAATAYGDDPSRSIGTRGMINFPNDGNTVSQVSAGRWHTCAVFNNFKVRCWGASGISVGQLGTDYATVSCIGVVPACMSISSAPYLSLTAQIKQVAAGDTNTCVLTTAGAIYCFGQNDRGQLGYPTYTCVACNPTSTSTPLLSTVPALDFGAAFTHTVVQIAVSISSPHSCAVFANGATKCWGLNFFGQLGQGNNLDYGLPPRTLTALPAINFNPNLDTTSTLSSLTVYATYNGGQSSGYATISPSFNPSVTFYTVTLPVTAYYVNIGVTSSSPYATIVVAGQVVASQSFSQSISVSSGANSIAVAVTAQQGGGFATTYTISINLYSATSVVAGAAHACMLNSASVSCWGSGTYGQTGRGSTANIGRAGTDLGSIGYIGFSHTFQATQIAAGADFTCVLFSAGKVICFGRNNFGQLGTSITGTNCSPTPLTNCCVGCSVGQIGSLPFLSFSDSQATVTRIAAGDTSACAIFSGTGAIICWGEGTYGALGYSNTVSQGLPGTLQNLPAITFATSDPAVDISVGRFHACALFTVSQGLNRARCWGAGATKIYGQLGTNADLAIGDDPARPVANAAYLSFADTLSLTQISAGAYHTCAISTGGLVRCWGAGGATSYGQLGYPYASIPCAGRSGCSSLAVLPYISFGATNLATMVSAGLAHTCVLFNIGSIKCFGGANGFNQLQIGLSSSTCISCGDAGAQALAVSGFIPFSQINGGIEPVATGISVGSGYFSIASFSNNRVVAWGAHDAGQLALGTAVANAAAPSLTSFITFSNLLDSVKTLASLDISSPSLTLSPAFSNGVLSYTLPTVPFTTTQITITATTTSSLASLRINSVWVSSGSPRTVGLGQGSNVISVIVYAQNGSAQTYSITISRDFGDTTNTLSALAFSPVLGGFAFASGTTSYTAQVSSSVSAVTVTATKTSSLSTMSIIFPISQSLTSGDPSSQITLNAAGSSTVVQVQVVSQSGSARTYSVTIQRASGALDSTNTLNSLFISGYSISPFFSSQTTSYTSSVPNTVTAATVSATMTSTLSSFTINDVPLQNGGGLIVSLQQGANSVVVMVTAQNGAVLKYTLVITRLTGSSDNALTSLIVSPVASQSPQLFNADTLTYQYTVALTTGSVTVTAIKSSSLASMTLNDAALASGDASAPFTLTYGATRFLTLIVTAQNGATRSYSLQIFRPALSSVSTLSALQLLNPSQQAVTFSPGFSSFTTAYSAVVPFETASVNVRPTLSSTAATVTVNAAAVASGALSAAIAIGVQQQSISIVVTAENGATRTYTVTITRLAQGVNPVLAGLLVNQLTLLGDSPQSQNAALTPAFASSITSYTATVPNNVNRVTLLPSVASDASALPITVNSAYSVTSGASSPEIGLQQSDSNTITVSVTNGVTTNIYTIRISRLPGSNSISGLAFSGTGGTATLSPDFAPSVTIYSLALSIATTAFTFTATSAFSTAQLSYTFSLANTTGSISIKSGTLSDALVVPTSSEGELAVTSTLPGFPAIVYTIRAGRFPDATLAFLSPTRETFSSSVTFYTFNVPYETTTVAINATCAIPLCLPGPATSTSSTKQLVRGSNVFTFTASGAGGKSTTYTLSVTRGAPDARLKSLVDTASAIDWKSNPFSSDQFVYNLAAGGVLPYHIASLAFKGECMSTGCKISISVPGISSTAAATQVAAGTATPDAPLPFGSTVTVSITSTYLDVAVVYSFIVLRNNPPTITAVMPREGPLIGGTTITVFGSGFADYQTFAPVLAGVPCNQTKVIEQTTATCTIASTAANSNVTLNASSLLTGNVSSSFGLSGIGYKDAYIAPKPPQWSYFPVEFGTGAKPVVMRVAPASATLASGAVITLTGFNLGISVSDLVDISLAGQSCSQTRRYFSSSVIACTVPPTSFVGDGPVFVRTASGGSSPLASTFSFLYPSPVLENAKPRVVNTTGGSEVTIRGSWFGTTNASRIDIRIGTVPCRSSRWVSESLVVCVTPPATAFSSSSQSVPVTNSTNNGTASSLPNLNAMSIRVSVNGSALSPPLDVGFRYGTECNPDCGWNLECLVSGKCADTCLGGFVQPPLCETPPFELIAPKSLVTSEDGDFVVATIRANAGAFAAVQASQYGFSIKTEPESEGIASVESVLFQTSETLPAERQIKLIGMPDSAKDGPQPWTATIVPQFSLPQGPSNKSFVPIRLTNLDQKPKVFDVTPKTLPQLGGNITIVGTNWDLLIVVTVDTERYNFSTYKGPVLSPARMTTTRHRLIGQQSDLLTSGSNALTFTAPKLNRTGYIEVAVVNLDGQRGVAQVFYTDDCPSEGQFGRGLDCKDCPKGGYCPGGYRIWPKEGYWTPSEDSGYVVECDPPEACKGGGPNVTSEAQCAPHYEGLRCGDCSKGYMKASGYCVLCPEKSTITGYIICSVILWSLFAIVCAFVHNKVALAKIILSIKLLQAVAGLGAMVKGKYQPWVRRMYAFFHLFSGDYDFVQPECGGEVPWWAHFFSSYAYTVVIFLPALILVGSLALKQSSHEKALKQQEERRKKAYGSDKPDDANKDANKDNNKDNNIEPLKPTPDPRTEDIMPYSGLYYRKRFKRVVVISLSIAYLPLSTLAFSTLACLPSSDHKRYYMVVRPNQYCWTKQQALPIIVSVATLIFLTAGLPLGLMFHLRRHREKMYQFTHFAAVWDSIYRSYQIRYNFLWFIEYPILVIVALGKSFFHVDPGKLQLPITLTAYIAKMVLILILRPFSLMSQNILQLVNCVVSIVAINFNYFASKGSFVNDDRFPTFFGLMLVATMISLIGYMLYAFVPGKSTSKNAKETFTDSNEEAKPESRELLPLPITATNANRSGNSASASADASASASASADEPFNKRRSTGKRRNTGKRRVVEELSEQSSTASSFAPSSDSDFDWAAQLNPRSPNTTSTTNNNSSFNSSSFINSGRQSRRPELASASSSSADESSNNSSVGLASYTSQDDNNEIFV